MSSKFVFGNGIELEIETSVESTELLLEGFLKVGYQNLKSFSERVSKLKGEKLDNKIKGNENL